MKMLRSRRRFPVPPFQGSFRSIPCSQGSRPGLCCATPSGFCNRDPWDFHGRARHSAERAEQHSPGRKPWDWGPEIASPERAAQKRLNQLAPHGVIFEAEAADHCFDFSALSATSAASALSCCFSLPEWQGLIRRQYESAAFCSDSHNPVEDPRRREISGI